MADKTRKPTFNVAVLRKTLRAVGRYRWLLTLSLLLAALVVGLTLYAPILVGQAIDRVLGPGQVDFAGIAGLLARLAGIAGLTAALQWAMGAIHNRVAYRVVRDLRARAFAKLQILPLRYLDEHPTGDLVSRVIADVDQISDGLLMGLTQLFTGVLTILGTLGLMLSIRWEIALVVLCVTPLSLFVARFFARRTYGLFRDQARVRGEQTAFLEELLPRQKVVAAFGHEAAALTQFDEINARLADSSLKATFYASLTNPCTRFVNALVYAGVGLTGALMSVVTGGAFSVGQLAAFLSYANQYTRPFNEISGVIAELQNALACAGRVFELIEAPAQAPDAPDAQALPEVRGAVTLSHVAFAYDPARPLIRDLSLEAKPGMRVAIVGPTGCGKTTLINLLLRFYEADAGELRVDGHSIRTLTRRSLRQSYGMVLQDTWLKTGTVRENLLLARPDATEAEMIQAAKAAHAHGFIQQLPNGYDTPLNGDGGSLSQGQKQLLCIARVMLALPPMLILDEATSSIDTRTEGQIQDAFARLTRGRTSFMVAHRLSTVREADLILVMRDGAIVESGNHEELLRRGGLYAALYDSQFAS